MNKCILSLILLMLNVLCFSQTTDFYDINTVNEIRLYFTQSNWDALLDQLYAAGEDRLVGTAVINGVTYDSVGVRYKGNSSYSPNRVKNPFNIKLDHIIEDQEIGPYGTLKLANGFSDPSFIRETLGYEIARKYMPASKANYANVYVNDVLIGAYTSVQDVDKHFGETYFGTGDNTRIKGINDQMQLWTIWGYINNSESSYANYYEVDSGENMSTFINFLNIFNNSTAQMESVFNVDRHLWMLAFDNLFVNLDAPINFGHNYYVYEDSEMRYNSVLWDLNMCFGGFNHLMTGGNLTATTMQTLNPLLNSTHASYPIISRVLSDPMYKRMYIAHMRTMIEENVTNGFISQRGAELQTICGPSVQADPNFFYTYANFQANLNNSVTGGGTGGPGQGNTVGITQLMNGRATSLLAHTAFSGTIPTINSNSHIPESPIVNSSMIFQISVTDATTAWLGFRQNSSGKFTRYQMYDDGQHNDGSEGDGLFAVTVDLTEGAVDYFYYVENSQQGRFLPARAEYEFLHIEPQTTTNGLLINEICAKNTTYADNNGEFEDWVEIYNPSENPVDIGGMFLCDNHYNSGIVEWTQIPANIPETTVIPAHGCLILWFDEDIDQGPLHINQKLGGSEDAVYLISSDSITIVDSYSWTDASGLNTDNVSIGRLPDGGANWVLFGAGQVNPWTPGATNQAADNVPPEISNVHYSPTQTTAETVITVQADVSDENNNLQDVTLCYGIGDETLNSIAMTLNEGHYTVNIGPFDLNTQLRFKVKAADSFLAESESPVYSIIIGYQLPVLFINELMASNTATVMDENQEYEDWVEIYNPNDTPVDLAGYFMTDSHYPETGTSLTQIPEGSEQTIIPAHGFKIIWFDEDTDQGPLHINTKLGSSGDAVYLIAPDMLTVVDQVVYTSDTGLGENLSYGRAEDGGTTWMIFGNGMPVTPGTSNVGNDNQDNNSSAVVKLNVYPNPVKDYTMINLEGTKSDYTVQIYNIKGQLVKTISGKASSSIKWDTRDHKGNKACSGIYFLKIKMSDRVLNKKICIIH